MARMAQIRLMQQQTELLKQQTDALRQQNQTANAAPQPASPAAYAMPTLAPTRVNGRVWKQMPSFYKVLYLIGIREGMDAMAYATGTSSALPRHFPSALSDSAVIVALDTFFEDSARDDMSVIYALDQLSPAKK